MRATAIAHPFAGQRPDSKAKGAAAVLIGRPRWDLQADYSIEPDKFHPWDHARHAQYTAVPVFTVRNLPMRDWWPLLVAKVRGHLQYYGVSGNFDALTRYCYGVRQLVKRALA